MIFFVLSEMDKDVIRNSTISKSKPASHTLINASGNITGLQKKNKTVKEKSDLQYIIE